VTRGRGRRRRTVGGGGLVTAEVGGVEGAAGVAGVFKILAFFFREGLRVLYIAGTAMYLGEKSEFH
jgi:hypothetical protein